MPTDNNESPIAITTHADTTGVRKRFQYLALRPTSPSKIPPKITAPTIPSYPSSGLVQITNRLPRNVKLTPITIGSPDPIFHTGYNCIHVPIPATNIAHCKSCVISAEVKCSPVPLTSAALQTISTGARFDTNMASTCCSPNGIAFFSGTLPFSRYIFSVLTSATFSSLFVVLIVLSLSNPFSYFY